jgi:hypothetical protein
MNFAGRATASFYDLVVGSSAELLEMQTYCVLGRNPQVIRDNPEYHFGERQIMNNETTIFN